VQPVHTADEIRAAEAPLLASLPAGELMGRAASGLAERLASELRERRGGFSGGQVLLAVGAGNNGGDALWAAVTLLGRGVRASAWRTSGRAHPEGWRAFLDAGGREVDAVAALELLADADLVVDGVLGIGGRPGLDPAVAAFADACRDTRAVVVAVDLPSGLDADAATASESFTADITVTFGARKLCHIAEPARSRCGNVEVVDIGLGLAAPSVTAWEASDVAAVWPVPGPESDKYSRGVLGVDTGSQQYPGAAVLSCFGAVHSGAGMVRYLGAAPDAVGSALPNVVTASGRVQAHLVGSGWGERPDGLRRLVEVLGEGLPTVVDADAIALLAGRHVGPGVLLTPHAGELARLLGVPRAEVQADPVGHARAAAAASGAVVLLKGASQYLAEPDGHVAVAVPGPAWTAQAGSGDVLAGICGTLLAAGLAPRDAALAASSVQALCARQHPGPFPPQDLARLLPQTIGELSLIRGDR